jgi:hypothetical protein
MRGLEAPETEELWRLATGDFWLFLAKYSLYFKILSLDRICGIWICLVLCICSNHLYKDGLFAEVFPIPRGLLYIIQNDTLY